MGIHSFHLAEVPPGVAARALLRHRTAPPIAGLTHIEHLSLMRLGAPAVSLERLQLRRMAVFAQWESEQGLEAHLGSDPLGRHLARGWHVRLELVRRWGAVTGLHRLPLNASTMDPAEPVVAVTLAHLKLSQLGRFFTWGRPVERLVRDHPGQTLAVAAVRPPRTFSTFSVWRSGTAMRDMVEGHGDGATSGTGSVPDPDRHARDGRA
ncbi:hypothetical protein [Luteipulveratus halotolerans]|uniref:hypothetical protein n=1 Tax=Luteipulveratus halotolerans TaxID=1631356 RepID=UPI000A6092F7|nr:hypothetical protein [Luteipulveratus halotolerans]